MTTKWRDTSINGLTKAFIRFLTSFLRSRSQITCVEMGNSFYHALTFKADMRVLHVNTIKSICFSIILWCSVLYVLGSYWRNSWIWCFLIYCILKCLNLTFVLLSWEEELMRAAASFVLNCICWQQKSTLKCLKEEMGKTGLHAPRFTPSDEWYGMTKKNWGLIHNKK